MFGGVLDAEQLDGLCTCGLQRPTMPDYVKLKNNGWCWLVEDHRYRLSILE